MIRAARIALAVLAIGLVLDHVAGIAHAKKTGLSDYGQDLELHDDWALEIDGYFRLRGDVLYNLDLDRGPTPSGALFFAVPLDDPDGQTLYQADMRLRTDLAAYAPGGSVAVKMRLDTLDNLTLGSTPDGIPSGSTTQRALEAPFRIRRLYAEVLTPIGLIAAGRMGNHWGLGMLANGGDCLDCDSGDSSDRIAFITPMAGHIWALAYDFSSSGPIATRASGFRGVDLLPSDDVRSVVFAVMQWDGEEVRARRHRAGRHTLEYGAYGAYRWQENDVPSWYLPVGRPALSSGLVSLDAGQVVPRGFSGVVADVWARFQTSDVRIELEAAMIWARYDEASVTPGVRFRDTLESLQFGAVLETDFGDLLGAFSAGLDGGFASGDPTPGFGAFPRADQRAAQPGDLDGPQASIPYDTRADNFRFHPDYRIDRILFREILGTVTDAFYFRPHARLRLIDFEGGQLTAHLFAVASFAVEPASTPGSDRGLGIEVDPSLVYTSPDGFLAALEYGVLFPLAGLDNIALDLRAQPAQLLRLRLTYAF
ncbi:MAG: TIGR04551 family protein [Myxococcota bacterium]|nr:TIGR04551 family protein [Myxococcota bacterium]